MNVSFDYIRKGDDIINNDIIIGLFGTCDKSHWRDKFISIYQNRNIPYYNPQIKDWKPEYAQIEAEHLANDKIILFPITYESYGLGSLSEIGFSVLNAIKLNDRRHFVILIDNYLDDNLQDENLRKESLKNRSLVKNHLLKLDMSNIYLVNNLENMLQVSLILYQSENIKNKISKYLTR